MRLGAALLVFAAVAAAQPPKPEDPAALFAELRAEVDQIRLVTQIVRSELGIKGAGAPQPPPIDWMSRVEWDLRQTTDIAKRLFNLKDQPGFPSAEQFGSMSADLGAMEVGKAMADYAAAVGEVPLRVVKSQAALATLRTSLVSLSGAARANFNSHIPMPGPLSDKWWLDPTTAMTLELTPYQVIQIERAYARHRPVLEEPAAALEREEFQLTATLAEAKFDHAKANAQLDRVAQARAELEKARGRMLLDIREVLRPRQWRALGESTKKE